MLFRREHGQTTGPNASAVRLAAAVHLEILASKEQGAFNIRSNSLCDEHGHSVPTG